MIDFEFRRIALARGLLPAQPPAGAGEETEPGPEADRDEAEPQRMMAARAGERGRASA